MSSPVQQCDEQKPHCSFCSLRGIECEYRSSRSSATPPEHGSSTAIIAKKSATTVVPSGLWPGAYAPAVLAGHQAEIRHTDYDLFLIHHFLRSTVPGFGPGAAEIYKNKVLSMAVRYPYLMHAMLALSACHLQHLGIDAEEYRMPEAFHMALASKGLRTAIDPISSNLEFDSVFTAAMLMNTLTFCLASYREQAYDDGSPQEPRFDWVRVLIGITDLLVRNRPFQPDSIWQFTFQASNDYSLLPEPENDMDQQLRAFCRDPVTGVLEEPYTEIMQWLSPIITRAPNPMWSPLYMRVVGAFTTEYIGLLEAKDTRALLIFSHWLALMSSINEWWCIRRTRRECWTICGILSRVLVGKDLALLDLPAKACGFRLCFEDLILAPCATDLSVDSLTLDA